VVRKTEEVTSLYRAVGECLAAYRDAASVTQGALARATSYDRTSICHVEAGRQFPPDRAFWETADAAVDAGGAVLAQYDWACSQILAIERVKLDKLDSERRARIDDMRGKHIKRTRKSAAINSFVTEPLPADNLEHALRHPSGTDLVAVAQIRDKVKQLDEEYDCAKSTSLIADAGKCLGQIAFLQGHVTDNQVRRDLGVAQADASILMGQLIWDASQRRDHRTAYGYFGQAIGAARQLRLPAVEGRALLRSSYLALYGEKNPKDGLALTKRAAVAAKGVSNTIASLSALHSAEAHSMLGQQRDCEAALNEAMLYIDQIDAYDPAIGLFSPTQHGRLAGSCFLALRQERRAKMYLEGTEKQLHGNPKCRSIVLGNLALASIRQKNLEEAVPVLHQAIDAVETTWGGGGLNVIFAAARELRPWRGTAAVRDFYDRLLSLVATA
jgi:hypothetical protein